MAADEQQPQHVVAIVRAVQPLDQGGLGVLQVGDQLLRRQRRRLALLAHPVEGGVAADQDQPGGRIARRPVLGPGLQGPQAGVLERLLGGVQVAEIAQQGRHRLGPGGGQGRVDPGERAVQHQRRLAVLAQGRGGRGRHQPGDGAQPTALLGQLFLTAPSLLMTSSLCSLDQAQTVTSS
jgi:hypothetical protein